MTNTVFIAGQTYKTRDGREALIYCTDAPGDYPVHGRVGKCMRWWTLAGRHRLAAPDGDADLMPS